MDGSELARRVEGIIGRRAFVPAGQGSTIVVGTAGPAPGGRGWLAVVEARSAGTTPTRRELGVDSPDCRQLDEAIVLVVALMVDSTEPQVMPLRIPAPPERPSVSIGLDVAIAVGMLPGAALGFGLASEIRIPPFWPVTLWTHAWPVSVALQDRSGGRLGAWTLGVGLCPLTLERSAWAVSGCLEASGGAVSSNGVGLDVSQSQTLGYTEAGARAGLRVRIAGPLFAAVDGGAAVPFVRYAYRFTQADGTIHDVFRTAAVILEGAARLEVRVP
jgi:hypothetical protein